MYNKIISQPYNLYLGRNSSDIIATISNRSSSVGETTFFLITVLSSLFLSIFITVTIFLIAPNEITSLLFFFLIFYFLIFLFIKKKLKNISATISDQSGNVIKLVQESLGSIREILIYKISNFFVPRFIKSNVKLREAMGNMVFITSSPGPLLHLIVIVSIIIFTYYFYSLGVLVDFIPILSAVVFGVQKLVPNINSTFASLASISVQEENLKKISDILNITNSTNYGYFNQKIKNNKNNIKFNNEIEFRNVSFFYNEENTFKLNNITFKIRKGNKIGLKGSSGSGKSTLIDLAMGLLKPSSGDILLDHEKLNHENVNAWQEKIAFVSQDIFLTDESILENITFSDNLKKINYEQINKILKDVNLLDYVNELPNGINSKVGERGSKLSGGQIQRLGIARALHKEREVIILDEATNALDKKNEKIIFDTLYKIKGLTLIVISHNEEIIKNCDQVFSLSEGKLKNLR